MGNMAIPIIGYIVAIISPIIGLIYGAVLFFFKKEVKTLFGLNETINSFAIAEEFIVSIFYFGSVRFMLPV